MNRDQRNCHYQSFGNLHYLSNPSLQTTMSLHPKKVIPKPIPKNSNQQPTSIRNYGSLVIDDSISFAARNSPQKTPNSQKIIAPLRYSLKQPQQTPSTYQHSNCGKSVAGSVSDHYQGNRKLQTCKESGHIYQEIIKVLESENHNIKEQNKYLAGEYKKISMENYKLKEEVESLKGYCGLKLEVEKLREINNTYQKLVEELKFILMEEMVAIHQKINFIMSTEDVSSVYNELQASLKKSNTLLNTERYHMESRIKQKIQHKSFEGTNLTEMLCLEDNEEEKVEKMRTYDTFDSVNNSNKLSSENYGESAFDSPTEATFY